MNTKLTATITAVGAAALASAVMIPAGAQSSPAPHGARHLTLVESTLSFHALDVPGAAADGQAGDIGVFESRLSTTGGRAVGRLAGQCLQVRADGTLDNCQVSVVVGRKSFQMAGLFDPATGGTFAITGGTGAWTGASGSDRIVNQPDGTAVHTISLRVD